MQKKKLILVINRFKVRVHEGLEFMAIDLARAFQSLGNESHESHVICLERNDELRNPENLKVHYFSKGLLWLPPLLRYRFLARRIDAFIKKQIGEPDLVLSNLPKANRILSHSKLKNIYIVLHHTSLLREGSKDWLGFSSWRHRRKVRNIYLKKPCICTNRSVYEGFVSLIPEHPAVIDIANLTDHASGDISAIANFLKREATDPTGATPSEKHSTSRDFSWNPRIFGTANPQNQRIYAFEENCPVNPSKAREFVATLVGNGKLISTNRHCTLVRSQWGTDQFVIKCYKTQKLRYLVDRFILGRSSLRTWNNIFLLRDLDIPTLEPVLLLEERIFCARGKSFLVTREINGNTFRGHLDKNNGNLSATLLENLRKMLKQLCDARLIHGDLHINNIMITDDRPILVDLEEVARVGNYTSFIRQFEAEKAGLLKQLAFWPSAMKSIEHIYPSAR